MKYLSDVALLCFCRSISSYFYIFMSATWSPYAHGVSPGRVWNFRKSRSRNFCVFLKPSLKTLPKATLPPQHIFSFDLSRRILPPSHLGFHDRCSHIAIASNKLICSSLLPPPPSPFPSLFSISPFNGDLVGQ